VSKRSGHGGPPKQVGRETALPEHTIETARVYLRPFTSDDLDAFALIRRYVKDARYYNTDVKYYVMTREEYKGDDSTYIHWPARD
jgi:hypothetical protein